MSGSFLGTPLTNHDVDQVRGIKLPKTDHRKFDVLAQVRRLRTGEKERISMHGAFTGGFAAGYRNTVGSKEGWVPKSFKSSRSSRSEHISQTAEDFMDDDDNISILKISNEFSQSVDDLDRLFGLESKSFGSNILSRIKWISKLAKNKKKELIGPHLPGNMKQHTMELFTRRMGDYSGIGYNQKTILKRPSHNFDEYGSGGLEYFRMGLDNNESLSIEDVNKRLEYEIEFIEVKEDREDKSFYIKVPDSFTGRHCDDSEEDFERMIKIMGNWRPLEDPNGDNQQVEFDGLEEMNKLENMYTNLVKRIEFVKQGTSSDSKVEKRGGRSVVEYSFDQVLFKRFNLPIVDYSRKVIEKKKVIRVEEVEEEDVIIDNEGVIPPDDLFKAIFGNDSDDDS